MTPLRDWLILALLGVALGAAFTGYGYYCGLTARQLWQLGLAMAAALAVYGGVVNLLALT
jgi:hypothetical protein